MSTYWYCASVNVCEFPVAGSVTVIVTVFGDKFSKYTSDDGVELDDEDDGEELLLCELVLWLDDVDDELCELDDDEGEEDEGEELCELAGVVDEEELLDDWEELCELDDICCSICCGEEYSKLKEPLLNTIVWTEDGANASLLTPPPGTCSHTSPLPDCHDTREVMSTYWYCASVNVCEFPVAGSITVKVVVFGDKFSKYTPIFVH